MTHTRAKAAGAILGSAALLCPPGAAAQNTWFFEVEYSDPAGVINSLDDTARVTLWVGFDPNLYAFSAGHLSVTASDDLHAGVWSDIERLLTGPGSKEGTAVDGTVKDIITNQLHFPSANIFADTSNPIEAWTAVWRTENLHNRLVPLSTATTRFHVYVDENGVSESFLDSLVEGVGEIVVVPAPGILAPGLLAVAIVGRRR
jgi:hypothetical protein